MNCTTSDCNQPTDLYLCTQCVSDLQASIEYAHRLLPDLDVTIARLDVTRPGNPETRSTNVAGSAAPANMDALQLKLNMEAVTKTATEYAHDPRVAGMAWLLGEWCKSAEVLISGPEEIRIDHEAKRERARKARGEPLPPREAIDYVRKKTKVSIKMYDFKNWVKLGKFAYVLDRVTSHDKPRKIYFPGDLFNVAKDMQDRRQKVW